jgi:hypothetical protein
VLDGSEWAPVFFELRPRAIGNPVVMALGFGVSRPPEVTRSAPREQPAMVRGWEFFAPPRIRHAGGSRRRRNGKACPAMTASMFIATGHQPRTA